VEPREETYLPERLTQDAAEHHRLLAYLAPWFGGSASDPLPPRDDPQRLTFNLDMVEAGWGALSVGAGFIVRMGSPGRLPFLETATRSEPREAAIAQAYGSDAGTGRWHRIAIAAIVEQGQVLADVGQDDSLTCGFAVNANIRGGI
jgi:hypothetical protein